MQSNVFSVARNIQWLERLVHGRFPYSANWLRDGRRESLTKEALQMAFKRSNWIFV